MLGAGINSQKYTSQGVVLIHMQPLEAFLHLCKKHV